MRLAQSQLKLKRKRLHPSGSALRRSKTCEGSWLEPTFAFHTKRWFEVRNQTDPAPEISRPEKPRENQERGIECVLCVYRNAGLRKNIFSSSTPDRRREKQTRIANPMIGSKISFAQNLGEK